MIATQATIQTKAEINMGSITQYVNEQVQAYQEHVLQAYKDAGMDWMQRAKAKTKTQGGFGNITFNLRSSIGFLLLHNGREIAIEFEAVANGEEGVKKGMDYARQLAGDFPSGIVLICVAGMEYAAAVESKGYDVITGSSLYFEEDLATLLSE